MIREGSRRQFLWGCTVRLHLAQLYYSPAYYDAPFDYLEEPCPPQDSDTPLGTLRSLSAVRDLLSASKRSYLEHFRVKLIALVRSSSARNADILVLPEYSVPAQLLPELADLARSQELIIVAGTHRVASDEEAAAAYAALGATADVTVGASYSPVLLPNGSFHFVPKLRRSKWEPNLTVPNVSPTTIVLTVRDGSTMRFAVIPCIDCLHPEVIGQLWSDGRGPHLIVCPSLSPPTRLFHEVASLTAGKEVVFAYVNGSVFGGSFVNVPTEWHPYLKGPSTGVEVLPADTEAVLEIDVDPERYFLTKHSVASQPVCSRPICFPIVYAADGVASKQLDAVRAQILAQVHADVPAAVDLLDQYLADHGALLPTLLLHNLRYVRHSILPLFSGDPESIEIPMSVVRLDLPVSATTVLWADRVAATLRVLGALLTDLTDTAVDSVLKCVRTLKNHQKRLPAAQERPASLTPTLPARDVRPFTGEPDLLSAFQNRGTDADSLRNALLNPETKVIMVTGPLGIGKTDFLNWVFQKVFPDWTAITIPIPHLAKAARVVADIAYALGVPIDMDSLESASHTVFRSKVRRVLEQAYSRPNRAIIIDDLHNVLRGASPRDSRQLTTLIEEAAQPPVFSGGRIFLASSVWLPEHWLRVKGVFHLPLKGLQDLYTRRVIEYHMRAGHLIQDEVPQQAPQALLNIVRGHPLSARLTVEVLRDTSTDLRQLTGDLIASNVTTRVAQELLKRIPLSTEEQALMCRLSVFRLPVRLDILTDTEPSWDSRQLLALAQRLVLNYDEHAFSMHEAVRRFFEAQTRRSPNATGYHHGAAVYYQKLYDSTINKRDPAIVAELAHHLALCGDLSKARDLRLLVLTEIKPAARTVYQEYRNYGKALELYTLLADVAPDDVEVAAYIGRCYARLGQWVDSDTAFEKAVSVANKIGQPSWWIYRDWGHIRARYQFYSEAHRLLDIAEARHPNDASIKSARANMYWKQGDIDRARENFENALRANEYHEFSLTFYAKLLDYVGDRNYAATLRKRLAELDPDTRYRPPVEYDLTEDYDD